MPELKGVGPSSSPKPEAVVAPELKVVKPSGSPELEVELVRLVVPELKGLGPSKFPEPGLRLVRRMMVEPARPSISIRKVASIYDEPSARGEAQISVVAGSVQDAALAWVFSRLV